jgi:hypothetical protein
MRGDLPQEAFGITGTAEQKAKLRSWAPMFVPYGITEFSDGGGGADIGPLRPLGTAMAGLVPIRNAISKYTMPRPMSLKR